jgi:cytochrome c oxidase subunit 2
MGATSPTGGLLRRTDGQRSKSWPRAVRSVILLSSIALVSCSEGDQSTLDPAGPGARRIEGLWWVLFWISAVVVVVVTVLIIISLRSRSKEMGEVERTKPRLGESFILIAGVVIPAVILIGTYVFSLREMNALAVDGENTDLEITVEAQNWWWEASYPNGAVTANEIHIPTGQPVRLKLTTLDVIHSFWVPRLQAKMDHIPDHENAMWIEADQPGRYRGQCAEFCGLQHAHMAFYVVAQSPEDFDAWVEKQAEAATQPSSESALSGESVFLNSTCVGCHTIRGTEAVAEIGPDLTHLADRETIGAGRLTNTRENLERFILDPQDVKPGIAMPPTDFEGEELNDLLDYLEQLD